MTLIEQTYGAPHPQWGAFFSCGCLRPVGYCIRRNSAHFVRSGPSHNLLRPAEAELVSCGPHPAPRGRGWPRPPDAVPLPPLRQPLYAARTLPDIRLNTAPGQRKRPRECPFRSGYAELSRCRGISRYRVSPPLSDGFLISFVGRDSNRLKKWQFLGGCGPRGPATPEFQCGFCQVAGPHGWQRATAGRGAGRLSN